MVNEQSGKGVMNFLEIFIVKSICPMMIHVGRVVFYFVSRLSNLHICL